MISQEKGYLVIAGAHDSDGVSQLYFWDGQSPNAQLLSTGGLPGNPEAIATFRGAGRENLFVLNDDGSRKVGGQECKKLKDPRARAFRGYELAL